MWRARILLGAFALAALPATAQVPGIIKEIGDLENVRDPKCYATANRLEDFIYGTSLEAATRFEKIALQKALIRDEWVKATAAATEAGKTSIDADRLRPILQATVPYVQTPDGNWIVHPDAAVLTFVARGDHRNSS